MSDKIKSKECCRLLEFRDFLQQHSDETNTKHTTSMSDIGRSCMTRNNNETYPVTSEELHAEIISNIYQQLLKRKCPAHFQLPILHAVTTQIERECRNLKSNELGIAINSRQSLVDGKLNLNSCYDLSKLQKFAINNLEKLLTRLCDNIEAENLKNYATNGTLCNGKRCECTTAIAIPNYVMGQNKNKMRKMEDRNLCLENFGELYHLNELYSFYGVFDGHSGATAASYVISHLPYLLAKQLKLQLTKSTTNSLTTNDARDAFETAFLEADRLFLRKEISSGTTAICALITTTKSIPHHRHLYVAWVGDSLALLVGRTASLQLVKPHKPDNYDERKRIETSETGGSVIKIQGQWRVNGILNVSRSIGDFPLKAVIAEPDFVDIDLTDKSYDFIILGTDGLWDHVDEAIIVKTIYEALADANQKLEDIPKKLIDLAKDGDSLDNITVVIIFLKERLQIVKNIK